ncbi:hypothetical protein TWF102_010662 [Orbilia oligospora]|uniref:Uncharacterized protein n=1 Tax=Orbilia oligospora TaxID=2813651 RepID=A0A7C8J5H7_ORBOL|nr:hypothetical protein TWF102_010662 [Orbilia oligospora]KAF3100532.1 hypothetical protein TWF103_008247 [Orbilia oligospora]KAF3110975.1 hypothetical protein TWF706_000428 [Orbilia oligospora]
MFPETGFTGVEVCRELCLKAGSKHTPSAQFAGTNRQASGLCRYPENEKKRISNVENPTRQCTKCGKFAKLVEVGFFLCKGKYKTWWPSLRPNRYQGNGTKYVQGRKEA